MDIGVGSQQTSPFDGDAELDRDLQQSFHPAPLVPNQGPRSGDDELTEDLQRSLAPRQQSVLRTGPSTFGAPNWANEHPLASRFLEDLGITAASLPLMAAGQEYVAGPLAARLATTLPRVASVLSGETASVPGLVARGGLEGAAASGIQYPYEKYQDPSATLGSNLLEGAKAGALMNPLTRLAFGRMNIDPELAQHALGALDQGVPIRIGQVPGASRVAAFLDKTFSLGADNPQRQALYRAMTRTARLAIQWKPLPVSTALILMISR
jgi:hypothetical protein